MEQYMDISHSIMTDIYNMSTCEKDCHFAMFTHNRKKLVEMLEFADGRKNSLIVHSSINSIDFVLIRGKSNYILEKNVLFAVKFDHNMLKSKKSMVILNDLLSNLEYQIGNNDLFEIERQRDFVKKQTKSEENDLDFANDLENNQEEGNHNLW